MNFSSSKESYVSKCNPNYQTGVILQYSSHTLMNRPTTINGIVGSADLDGKSARINGTIEQGEIQLNIYISKIRQILRSSI